jgi:beta-lactamase regulating signal transducer with metallopeptidase domain
MWDWTDRTSVILFDAALSTAVFLTFIVLAMLACRQPARRILLARVALLASVAILPLVAFGRLPRLDVIDTLVESRFFPRSLFLGATNIEATASDAPDTRPVSVAEDRVLPQWLPASASAAGNWLPRGLTLLDLMCAAAGSAWLVLGLAGVHWVIYRSRPPASATRSLFEALVAGRSRAVARTGLRVCSRLRHPVATGFFHPTILIPEALDQADGDVELLRLSLLHEIAHAERSDHWFSTAASMAQAIWFFIPHVWWIRSQLLIDQEFLADRSAAEHYGATSEYASALLALVTPDRAASGPVSRTPARDATAIGTFGVQSPLFQRIMMLLHCPYPVESRTPRVWSWTSRLAVVVASIAAACLVIRWPQASLAVPAPSSASSARSRFQVDHFIAEPLHDGSAAGRSLVYIMPVALPPHFDLSFEVRTSEADLSQIRIAGLPLGVPGGATMASDPLRGPASPGASGSERGATDWHRVHLHSDHRQVSVVVDGHTIPGPSSTAAASYWLTVEPPSHVPAEFRHLMITW